MNFLEKYEKYHFFDFVYKVLFPKKSVIEKPNNPIIFHLIQL